MGKNKGKGGGKRRKARPKQAAQTLPDVAEDEGDEVDDRWREADLLLEKARWATTQHKDLWAQVRGTVAQRDAWNRLFDTAKAESVRALELRDDPAAVAALSKTESLDASRRCFAMERSYKARRKKLLKLNSEMMLLLKQITVLEQTYPVKSEEAISAAYKVAVLADDPGSLVKLLKTPCKSKKALPTMADVKAAPVSPYHIADAARPSPKASYSCPDRL